MAAGHSWSTGLRFFLYVIVFLPLINIFALSRKFWIILFGEYRDDRRVEVRRVVWRFKLRESLGNVLDSCLHVHARYENLRSFAWLDPRVHLYNISDIGVTLVRTTEGIDVYHSSVSPFAFLSVLDYAEEFAVVPLEVFRNLALAELARLNSDADAKKMKKVVVMSSPPRCGSTVMLQHFEDVSGCVAISEPQAPIDLFFLSLADSSRAARLFSPVFLFVCKTLFVRCDVSLLAVKLCVVVPWMMKDVIDSRDQLPFDLRFLFTHRNPMESFDSWLRVATELLSDPVGFGDRLPILGRLFPDPFGSRIASIFPSAMKAGLKSVVASEDRWATRFSWVEKLDFEKNDKEFLTLVEGRPVSVGRSSLTAHFFCFFLVGTLTLYELKRRSEYADAILPISYEVLISNPSIWTQTILPFCGLEKTLSTALRRDSQRMSPFNRRRLTTHRTKMTSEEVNKLDGIVKSTGIAKSLKEFELRF